MISKLKKPFFSFTKITTLPLPKLVVRTSKLFCLENLRQEKQLYYQLK